MVPIESMSAGTSAIGRQHARAIEPASLLGFRKQSARGRDRTAAGDSPAEVPANGQLEQNTYKLSRLRERRYDRYSRPLLIA